MAIDRRQGSTSDRRAEACRCRPPWPARGLYRWAGREMPVIVLSVEASGDSWIIDAEGDVLAVDAYRIRIPPASLDQIRGRVA